MPEREHSPSSTSRDSVDAHPFAETGDADIPRAFLQRLQARGELTPYNVAMTLHSPRSRHLRDALLMEISSGLGSAFVRQVLEAERQLDSSSPPVSLSSPPTSGHVMEQSTASSAHAPSPGAATMAAQGGEQGSAIERAIGLSRLGVAHLGAIETALLPAYRRAVAAMDTAAVKALALQIVGSVARIVDAQDHVVRLVPQADTGPHAAMSSTADTDPFTPDASKLATLTTAKAALDAAVLATVPKLAVQVSPQWFGDDLVAGRSPEPPPHVREVLVQLTYEAGLVVQLLEEADAIESLIRPVNAARGTSEQATDGGRAEAVAHLDRWRSRPINFMFLVRTLTQRGVWQSMQGIKDAHGHTAAELERKVFVQSKETGTTADVGEAWDADEAHRALSYSMTDWKVTDEEASRVFDMLAKAEPRARGELVKQLYRMGRLRVLCEHLPWGQVKQLWESIQDPEASKLLEPYWDGKGGGKSLGKRLEEQDHWYTNALNRFLDIATFGAKPRIDASYDAREAGLITDDAYWASVNKAVGRAAFMGAATAAVGGVAGELVAGGAEGMGLSAGIVGRGITTVASGATAGGFGNVAGHLVGDVYDQVLEGKEGFDSASSYGKTFGDGALLGGATAAVGLVASRYLPQGARTLAQDAAVARPHLTRVLETVRSVGLGAGVKLQTTVRDFLDMLGGPPAFRFAYAGSPAIPARLASAPPAAHVWIVVRPLKDLNAPMKMEGGDHSGALGEIESVEPGDEIAAIFDEYSGAEGDTYPEANVTGESSKLGESGPELEALGVRPRRPAGVVDEPGQVHTDQHHVFPQQRQFAEWFRDRGIDIHDWCIDLTPAEHKAQHGGGNWTLARDVAQKIPEAEWNAGIMDRLFRRELLKQRQMGDPRAKLTPDEIIEVAKRFMKSRDVDKLPFRRYSR